MSGVAYSTAPRYFRDSVPVPEENPPRDAELRRKVVGLLRDINHDFSTLTPDELALCLSLEVFRVMEGGGAVIKRKVRTPEFIDSLTQTKPTSKVKVSFDKDKVLIQKDVLRSQVVAHQRKHGVDFTRITPEDHALMLLQEVLETMKIGGVVLTCFSGHTPEFIESIPQKLTHTG